ncbi:uncharacterized protein TNIN_174751 [Trichonephila inaurata madagascariensis]|uniref:Protein SSUH2 homolog n=1 Tax=Trichonephila inaurata madagascariensis TaxID=2747483 RepID=A0A8X6XMJ2_9ARAC|nr:uncharacterized protein TNIN_174751 [Trichonephila inaurata madagascariensis]
MSHSRDTTLVPTVYLLSSDGIEPPSYEESEAESLARSLNTSPNPGRPLLTLFSLNDEELRRFCYKYIDIDCCYGSRFIKEMILTEIWNDCAFLYTVESLSEKRETSLAHTPYSGRLEEGPEEEGPAPPDRWLVHVIAPNVFVDNSTTTEIPFSAYIKKCTECNGQKQWTCYLCDPRGKEKCQRCNGIGWLGEDYRCPTCVGTGKVLCCRCHGTKIVKCGTCDAYGKLRFYTKLTVKWKRHKLDHISNASKLPTDLIRKVSGKELFKEQGETVQALNFPINSALNEASTRLITSLSTPVNARVLMQRHSVVAIPYTRATYIWRRKKGQFYVYGYQQEVYFQEYPQQCCCCTCC